MTNFVGPETEPDKYELIELRSQGAEGAVWKARLKIDSAEVLVALKIVLPHNEQDIDAWRKRWTRQAEMLRSLNHPGLMTVREAFLGASPHEAGQVDNDTETLYLAMNWIEGPSLTEWVVRNPDRDVLESIRVISDLSAAVDYLHNGGSTGETILHRDIKPANVIISDGIARLVDFGFVRAASSIEPMTMVGSPAYLAPEVVASLQYSSASDRFALGSTAYFALTGQHPTIDDPAAMSAALNSVKGLAGRPDLHQHILSMLSRDPANRPQSAIEWAQGMAVLSVIGGGTALIGTMNAPSAPLAPQEPGRRHQKKKSRKVLFALVSLLVVGGAAAALAVAGGAFNNNQNAGTQTTTAAGNTDQDGAGAVSTTGGTGTTIDSVEMAAVPNVVGMLQFEASTALGEAGFANIEFVNEMSEADPGTVLAVDPSEGTEAARDSKVFVTVATEILVTMPDLDGVVQDFATAEVTGLGLSDVTVTESPSVKPPGTVISQVPEAGVEIALDFPVLLVVASIVETPDLLAMTGAERSQFASSVGAKITTTTVYDPDAVDGDVIGQSPAVGEPLTEEIVLEVAEGPSAIFLEDMVALEMTRGDMTVSFGQGDVDGDRYIHALVFFNQNYLDTGHAEYNLSRDFDRLTASVGYSDSAGSSGQLRLEVFGDGAVLFTEDFQLGSGLVGVVVDTSDVLRLDIVVTVLCCTASDIEELILGEIRLLGEESKVAQYRD